jgi:hypothetical protein
MFLQSNAPDRVGPEGAANSEMRWPGAGAHEDGHGSSRITVELSTESVDNALPASNKSMIKNAPDVPPKKQSRRPAKQKDVDHER